MREGWREGRSTTYLIGSLTNFRRRNLVFQLSGEVSAGGEIVVHARVDVFA